MDQHSSVSIKVPSYLWLNRRRTVRIAISRVYGIHFVIVTRGADSSIGREDRGGAKMDVIEIVVLSLVSYSFELSVLDLLIEFFLVGVLSELLHVSKG